MKIQYTVESPNLDVGPRSWVSVMLKKTCFEIVLNVALHWKHRAETVHACMKTPNFESPKLPATDPII